MSEDREKKGINWLKYVYRCFAVDKWRVVESHDAPNYVFKDGMDVRIVDA
jgi:hypothetical protein